MELWTVAAVSFVVIGLLLARGAITRRRLKTASDFTHVRVSWYGKVAVLSGLGVWGLAA